MPEPRMQAIRVSRFTDAELRVAMLRKVSVRRVRLAQAPGLRTLRPGPSARACSSAPANRHSGRSPVRSRSAVRLDGGADRAHMLAQLLDGAFDIPDQQRQTPEARRTLRSPERSTTSSGSATSSRISLPSRKNA